MAKAYRFRDAVAVHTPGGPTVYMAAHDAKAFADSVRAVVVSIQSGQSFANSNCDGPDCPAWLDAGEAMAAHAEHVKPPESFIVTVAPYSLAAGRIGEADGPVVYMSSHRSPHAAARRLAELINGHTKRARDVRDDVAGRGAKWLINGLSLTDFRAKFCDGR